MRNKNARAGLLGALLLLATACGSVSAQATDPRKSEAALRRSIQQEWLNLAEFAIAKNAAAVAKRALAEAAAFDPEPGRYGQLRKDAAALSGDEDLPVVQRREQASLKRIVTILNRLATLDVSRSRRARMDGYLWRAFELLPDNTGSIRSLRRIGLDAAKKEHLGRARRIIEKAKVYDPTGMTKKKYLLAEGLIGRKDMLLLKSPAHSMLAYLMLPPGWKPKGKWKTLVHIEGKECRFRETLSRYKKRIAETPYMVVVPATFSQTELMDFARFPYDIEVINRQLSLGTKGKVKFDAAGLDAILEVVRGRFNGQKNIYLTGHAEAGPFVYWWMHHRSASLFAGAPVSARWRELCADDPVKPKGWGPWIRIFTAAKDSSRVLELEKTATEAAATYTSGGFKRVDTKRVMRTPEELCTKEVLAWFEAVSKKGR